MLQTIFIIPIIFIFLSLNKQREIDSEYYCEKLNLNCKRDNQNVLFKTSKGDFEVELFAKDNPLTVSNFVQNIEKNIYQNIRFYKIITYPQLRLIYSGVDADIPSYENKNQFFSNIGPSIPLEIRFKKQTEPKYNYQVNDSSEFENLVHPFNSGYLAMAKKGDKNSSSTEFFFVTNKIPELDGRYSVFGKIIKGLKVLNKIEKNDIIYVIKSLN